MCSLADAISQQPSVHREINTTGGGKASFESRHLCTQTKIYILNIVAPCPGPLSVYKTYCHVYVLNQEALKRSLDDYECRFWVEKYSSLKNHPLLDLKVSWCDEEETVDINMIFAWKGIFELKQS